VLKHNYPKEWLDPQEPGLQAPNLHLLCHKHQQQNFADWKKQRWSVDLMKMGLHQTCPGMTRSLEHWEFLVVGLHVGPQHRQ
jgi:hypothetical protein